MLTIIFYSTNGPAAKQRSREIVAKGKQNYARVYDVSFWDGRYDDCDEIEIMPDVPKWQRARITEVYGDVQERVISDEEGNELSTEKVEPTAVKPMGLMPKRKKKAEHRGGGRWFVMSGSEVISGPHDKAEAKRLAELDDEPEEVTETAAT